MAAFLSAAQLTILVPELLHLLAFAQEHFRYGSLGTLAEPVTSGRFGKHRRSLYLARMGKTRTKPTLPSTWPMTASHMPHGRRNAPLAGFVENFKTQMS